MKRITGTVLLCALTLGAVTSCAPVVEYYEPQATETTEEVPARPQDDYYRYINEDELKNATFGYNESSASSAFNQKYINDQIETVIKDTVAGDGYAKGSEENEALAEFLETMIDQIEGYNGNNLIDEEVE